MRLPNSGTRYTAAGKKTQSQNARSTYIARHIAQKGITNYICMTGHPALSILAGSACGMLSRLGQIGLVGHMHKQNCQGTMSSRDSHPRALVARRTWSRAQHTTRHRAPCAPAAREAEQAGCGGPGVGPAAALPAAGGSH